MAIYNLRLAVTRGSGSCLTPSHATVVIVSLLVSLPRSWPWRTCGGGTQIVAFWLVLVLSLSLSFHCWQETGLRDLSHISWQWLLMVNINDGRHRLSVTASDNKRDVIRLRYTWHVAVTRYAGLQTTAARTTQLSWAVNWYGGLARLIYLIYKCLKGSRFCDRFLCPPVCTH